MATETGTADAMGKLHRASCIVAHIADDVLPGETLKAAEDLILAAMEQLRGETG